MTLSPAFNSQSASSQADTGALSSVTIPLARLRLFEFFPALMTAGRHVLSGLRIAIHLRQKSFRGCAQAFHFPTLSALRGLVAVSDTHRDSKKEMSCVTSLLTGTTKCL